MIASEKPAGNSKRLKKVTLIMWQK